MAQRVPSATATLSDDCWAILCREGVCQSLAFPSLVQLAQCRRVLKSACMTEDHFLRLRSVDVGFLCKKESQLLLRQRFGDICSFEDLEVFIFKTEYPDKVRAPWFMDWMKTSRLCNLSKLRVYDVKLTDHMCWNEGSTIYLPQVEASDVLRIMTTCPRLEVFVHDLYSDSPGNRHMKSSRVVIDSKLLRKKFFQAARQSWHRFKRFCVEFYIDPSLSADEEVTLRTLMPHQCAFPRGSIPRCVWPQAGAFFRRIEWGNGNDDDDECLRRITTQLIPADFNSPWTDITGQYLLRTHFPHCDWNSLSSCKQNYFSLWAEKCKAYEKQPFSIKDWAHENDFEPSWIVMRIDGIDSVGLLSLDGAVPNLANQSRVRWLPTQNAAAHWEVVNWHRLGPEGWKALERHLQLRELLVGA